MEGVGSVIEDPELEYISRKALREHKKRLKKEKKESRVFGQGGQEWVDLHRKDSMVAPEYRPLMKGKRRR